MDRQAEVLVDHDVLERPGPGGLVRADEVDLGLGAAVAGEHPGRAHRLGEEAHDRVAPVELDRPAAVAGGGVVGEAGLELVPRPSGRGSGGSGASAAGCRGCRAGRRGSGGQCFGHRSGLQLRGDGVGEPGERVDLHVEVGGVAAVEEPRHHLALGDAEVGRAAGTPSASSTSTARALTSRSGRRPGRPRRGARAAAPTQLGELGLGAVGRDPAVVAGGPGHGRRRCGRRRGCAPARPAPARSSAGRSRGACRGARPTAGRRRRRRPG